MEAKPKRLGRHKLLPPPCFTKAVLSAYWWPAKPYARCRWHGSLAGSSVTEFGLTWAGKSWGEGPRQGGGWGGGGIEGGRGGEGKQEGLYHSCLSTWFYLQYSVHIPCHPMNPPGCVHSLGLHAVCVCVCECVCASVCVWQQRESASVSVWQQRERERERAGLQKLRGGWADTSHFSWGIAD